MISVIYIRKQLEYVQNSTSNVSGFEVCFAQPKQIYKTKY